MGYQKGILGLSRWLAMALISLISGCEKVPTFQELTGQEAKPAATEQKSPMPVTANPAPVTSLESKPMPKPVSVEPSEVIAKILQRPPHEISHDDLVNLTNLPSGLDQIHSLDLTKSSVSDAGVKLLPKLPQLTNLNLSYLKISGNSLESLKAIPDLRNLSLEGIQGLSPESWEIVADLSHLETLSLLGTFVTDDNVSKLARLPNLKELNLTQTLVTDAVFSHVAEMKTLEVLRFEGLSSIDGHGLQVLAKAKSNPLRELHASRTKLGIAGLKHIKSIPSLRLLDITSSNLTDQQLYELRGAGNIVTLKLGFNLLTAAGVPALVTLRDLEELDLQNNMAIDDRALGALSKMKGLKTLNVTRTSCTPRGLQEFARLQKNCKLIFSDTPNP